MTTERADLGFGATLNDLTEFGLKPKEPRKPKVNKSKTQNAAEAAGFRSRESKAPKPAHQLRRRRTGRNVQFNLKAKPETIEAFCKVADANGWGLGETLECAVDPLAKEQSI